MVKNILDEYACQLTSLVSPLLPIPEGRILSQTQYLYLSLVLDSPLSTTRTMNLESEKYTQDKKCFPYSP